MLVLSRRVGEEIVIDGHINVTVVAVKGDRVRLGIDAPSFVSVDRREVHERRAEVAAEPDDPPEVSLPQPGTHHASIPQRNGQPQSLDQPAKALWTPEDILRNEA
jgi:carbon storage regulator